MLRIPLYIDLQVTFLETLIHTSWVCRMKLQRLISASYRNALNCRGQFSNLSYFFSSLQTQFPHRLVTADLLESWAVFSRLTLFFHFPSWNVSPRNGHTCLMLSSLLSNLMPTKPWGYMLFSLLLKKPSRGKIKILESGYTARR